jgi:hypothetical protein
MESGMYHLPYIIRWKARLLHKSIRISNLSFTRSLSTEDQ